ncbi:MAG: lysophospholipase [Halanaerobiales bacterium]|nr:lysophospholipase [Halanaerobiales bacterium]
MNLKTKEEFSIKGSDGMNVFVHCWNKVAEPRAVVQIFHGMAEHAARYERFAKYLNSEGFIVYANDHRGHGRTAGSVEELGYIGQDGFNMIVEDEYIITELIQEKHQGLPIIVFGHSFGSFIAQEYIINYGKEIVGVVLCGSAAKLGIEVHAGKMIAGLEKIIFGERKKSKLLDFLSFGSYNKRIKNNTCRFDWLSTDVDEVKKYEEDPYSGTLFTVGFFYYFLQGLSKLYKKDRLAKIPKDLPIFIIAGDQDPVGNYGRLVKKLYSIYQETGIHDVKMRLYPGGRHELLNEVNRDEVALHLLTWFNEIT